MPSSLFSSCTWPDLSRTCSHFRTSPSGMLHCSESPCAETGEPARFRLERSSSNGVRKLSSSIGYHSGVEGGHPYGVASRHFFRGALECLLYVGHVCLCHVDGEYCLASAYARSAVGCPAVCEAHAFLETVGACACNHLVLAYHVVREDAHLEEVKVWYHFFEVLVCSLPA